VIYTDLPGFENLEGLFMDDPSYTSKMTSGTIGKAQIAVKIKTSQTIRSVESQEIFP
jgi:hypothetical protein